MVLDQFGTDKDISPLPGANTCQCLLSSLYRIITKRCQSQQTLRRTLRPTTTQKKWMSLQVFKLSSTTVNILLLVCAYVCVLLCMHV